MAPTTPSPTAAGVHDVLDFWFGVPPLAARAEWFRKDDAFDGLIRQRFGSLVEAALGGALGAWADTPAGALAQVIVLDQFPRNLFRGQPRSFAGDALALGAARAIVERGWDRSLPGVQRSFVYLPFEHAEDAAAQAESMRLFGRMAADDPSMADALEWARRHQQVIERFGRFPHRNEVLGRASTPDELAFLRQPGSRF